MTVLGAQRQTLEACKGSFRRCVPARLSSSRAFPCFASRKVQAGIREGIDAGREASIQVGFDAGFATASRISFELSKAAAIVR